MIVTTKKNMLFKETQVPTGSYETTIREAVYWAYMATGAGDHDASIPDPYERVSQKRVAAGDSDPVDGCTSNTMKQNPRPQESTDTRQAWRAFFRSTAAKTDLLYLTALGGASLLGTAVAQLAHGRLSAALAMVAVAIVVAALAGTGLLIMTRSAQAPQAGGQA